MKDEYGSASLYLSLHWRRKRAHMGLPMLELGGSPLPLRRALEIHFRASVRNSKSTTVYCK